MIRVGLLVIGLFSLAAAAAAEQPARWEAVCNHDDATATSPCFVSFFDEDKASGNGLGIAVQLLDGWYEIQVSSNGGPYSRAEINIQSDTTIVTDYCYDTYCVFVRAKELVEQFRKGWRADVRLYNGLGKASIKERVSLRGFTAAHEDYLSQIGEGVDSIDPASDCEDVDHGEEVAAELFEARCQSSHVLHAAEETLDDVALGVEPGVVGDRVPDRTGAGAR